MKNTVKINSVDLINADCLHFIQSLPDDSIDLIVTDPPYFKVKPNGWDNQWKGDEDYLKWLDHCLAQFWRVLKPAGSLYLFCGHHPRKLVTLNPKLKSTAAGRYQLLSRWWDAYRKQLGLKDFSPKSQDAVALQQIKERGALPMIDRGDIRQAIDRCSNIWASLPGAGYGQYEHKIGDLISRFKEAGGVVNEAEI